MSIFQVALRRFAADEDGATAIEYGLIAAMIAVGAIVAMTTFGGSLGSMFNTVATKASDAIDSAGND